MMKDYDDKNRQSHGSIYTRYIWIHYIFEHTSKHIHVKKMNEMCLGDAFTRRKAISSEIGRWQSRLRLAGRDDLTYEVKNMDDDETKAIPGTKRSFNRHYTIKECLSNITKLVEEDKDLALRISKTNQVATATMKDLEDNEVILTIPELIILKNDILPTLLSVEDYIPDRAEGVNIIDSTGDGIVSLLVQANSKRVSEIKDGMRIDKDVVFSYTKKKITDYGYTHREKNDRRDKLLAWEQRLKEAINQANKTILVEA